MREKLPFVFASALIFFFGSDHAWWTGHLTYSLLPR
jgi:hypothetical protein